MKKIILMLGFFVISGFILAADPKQFNVVEGLALPSPIEVMPNTKNIVVEAKTKGEVKWLVISKSPISYQEFEKEKKLVINNATNSDINIFANALVDGKLTDFAKTKISIKEGKKKEEIKPSNKIYVTVYVDYKNLTSVQNEIISIPFNDSMNKFYYAEFKSFDINSFNSGSKEINKSNFPDGLLVIKNESKNDIYFGSIPKDAKIFIDILTSLKPKGA